VCTFKLEKTNSGFAYHVSHVFLQALLLQNTNELKGKTRFPDQMSLGKSELSKAKLPSLLLGVSEFFILKCPL
jgi:hypothetical protein